MCVSKDTITSTQPTFLPFDVSVSVREEGCSVLLPVLATIVMWRGKKSIVRVLESKKQYIFEKKDDNT